jgi:hypothetical protein
MNKQEIFNTVYNGLKSQGFKQSRDGNLCRYRSCEGKCAAGHLLPDDVYTEAMEGNAIEGVSWFLENFEGDNLDFIDELQQVHDGFQLWSSDLTSMYEDLNLNDTTMTPQMMYERLTFIAWKHGLECPE